MTTSPLPPGSQSRKQATAMAMATPVFLSVFLIVTIIATTITFILPESYASTARVKVDATPAPSNEGYFIHTETEVIQSQVVLDKAIEKLDLNVFWGKKYLNGETLKTAESLLILKGRLSVAPISNTKLIAITAYSEDRHEAAQIANAIAAAYQDFYQEKQKAEVAKSPEAHPAVNPAIIITDLAEPAATPCKPNKPLNIVLGALAGIILGGILAGAVWLLRSR